MYLRGGQAQVGGDVPDAEGSRLPAEANACRAPHAERCTRRAGLAEGCRVELTVGELARVVGSRIGNAHRDEDLA